MLFTRGAIFAILVASSSNVFADIVIISNATLGNKQISKDNICNLYLGNAVTLPGVKDVTVVDQDSAQSIKPLFYKSVCNVELPDLNAKWTKKVFTGEARRPISLKDDLEVISFVRKTPGSIGYVNSTSQLPDQLQIIYTSPMTK